MGESEREGRERARGQREEWRTGGDGGPTEKGVEDQERGMEDRESRGPVAEMVGLYRNLELGDGRDAQLLGWRG